MGQVEPVIDTQDISVLLKTKAAEAFASGCVRRVPFGTGWPSDGWPPDRLVSGPKHGKLARFYRFIDNHRDLLTNTESAARVALVYGIPTVVWNHFPTFDIGPGHYKAELGGWARALEMSHIPYDIVLLDMDQVFEHEGLADRLDRYDLILAPGTGHVSDCDLAALSKFVSGGGTLLATAALAERDELNNPRSNSSRSALLSAAGVAAVEPGLGFDFHKALEQKRIDQGLLDEMKSILFASVPLDARIETNGPETLLVSPLVQPEENRLLVHLVNYDYGHNADRDWTNPIRDLSITLSLPEGFAASEVRIITPDDVSTDGFTWSENKGVVELQVPELDLWNTIVLEGR